MSEGTKKPVTPKKPITPINPVELKEPEPILDDIRLDPVAAGAYLGGEDSPLKPTTLADWRVDLVGPSFIKVGRLIRYNKRDLDAYLNKQKRIIK